MTEKNALARVLLLAKSTYTAVKDGAEFGNLIALIDEISAALSHFNDEKQPLAGQMGKLRRIVRFKNKQLYPSVKLYFRIFYAPPELDAERAAKHIPAIIYANDLICAKLVSGERDKAKSMCNAMASYPGYIFGEYESLSDKQFYDLVFGYYPKFYDDDFMGRMKYLFDPSAPKPENNMLTEGRDTL